jgi:hypothetical protein
MAGITLETAQKHLDAWLEAEMQVTNAQSYTIGSRTLTKANLTEIRNAIEYWQQKVTMLENLKKNNGRSRVKRFVPRDL